MLLLLAEGRSYRELRDLLFVSNDLVAGCVARFRSGGAEALMGQDRGPALQPMWWSWIRRWVLTKTPQDFGYFRVRWSCSTLAEVPWWEKGIRKSAECVRRILH